MDSHLLHYGYLVLFVGTLLEGDAVLLAAAFLAHRGYLSLPIVILVSSVATILADQLYYSLARRGGRDAFARKAASDQRFRRIGGWIGRRGKMLLFVSRFLYGFRIAIPAACGATGMQPTTFFLVNVAGSLFWATLVGFGGYVFGNTLDFLLLDLRRYELAIAVLLLVAAVVALAIWSRDVGAGLEILRRPAQSGLDSAVALFATTHRAGRLLLSHPHTRLATFVVALGCLNLSSALFFGRFARIASIAEWLPLEVSHGSRALMVLVGLVLLTLGRGLARRKRVAWVLAVSASALSVALHLGHYASLLHAAASAALVVVLLRHRARFSARSDPFRLRYALLAAPVLALAVSTFGCAGFRELNRSTRPVDALSSTWKTALFEEGVPQGADRRVRAFIWSLQSLSVLSVAYLLGMVLAPVVLRSPAPVDRDLIERLAWDWGLDSLSYFAKQPDKRHILVEQQVFLGFRLSGRVAVVAGDPVGPPGLVPAAIDQFVASCSRNDWIPVFYEVSERYLQTYRAAGLRYFKVGEEAVVPLAAFTLQGNKIASVRQTLAKFERESPDVRVFEYRRDPPDPELDEQLEEISADWLSGKRGGEMTFNLGVFSVEDLADKRTLVAATDSGYATAFLTWLPYRGGHALLLDAMRKRHDAPYGVIDVLIARSALKFKEEGIDAISLATAPLANVNDTLSPSPYDKGVKLIFDHVSAIYGYQTLFKFKRKFNPAWEPRCLVFPRPDLLPRIAYALVAVHAGEGILGLLRRR